jgi:hypothetical protein
MNMIQGVRCSFSVFHGLEVPHEPAIIFLLDACSSEGLAALRPACYPEIFFGWSLLSAMHPRGALSLREQNCHSVRCPVTPWAALSLLALPCHSLRCPVTPQAALSLCASIPFCWILRHRRQDAISQFPTGRPTKKPGWPVRLDDWRLIPGGGNFLFTIASRAAVGPSCLLNNSYWKNFPWK